MKLQKVLVPVDGSPKMSELVEKAIAFARKTSSTLTFLHVVHRIQGSSSKENEQQRTLYSKILDECRKKAAAESVSASSRIEIGSPVETILNLAEREKFDLIIIGSKGHSLVKTLLVGSVADQVMEHATCPVLLVK